MSGPLSNHIEKAAAALARTVVSMDRIESQFDFPLDCCPSCACGPQWHALHVKAGRQASWLAKMLDKRGGAGDAQRAVALRRDWCSK